MMREVLTRRFGRALQRGSRARRASSWPDLVLIDGGQGQLEVARQVLSRARPGGHRHRRHRQGARPRRRPRALLHARQAALLARAARPGAVFPAAAARRGAPLRHRHASHAARRRADRQSALDEVPGIGAGRKRALLHHFGSARAVAVATLEDIKAVPGISDALAQKIHDHFRGGRLRSGRTMLQSAQPADAVADRGDSAGRRLLLARPRLGAVAVGRPVRRRRHHRLVRRLSRPPLSPDLAVRPLPRSDRRQAAGGGGAGDAGRQRHARAACTCSPP